VSPGTRGLTLEERFWTHVDTSGGLLGCWIWTGTLNAFGYGVLGRGRRGEGNVLAHRYTLELDRRPVPEGADTLHHCDNRRCVNPAHLSSGSRLDNVRDMMTKGRHAAQKGKAYAARGEAHPMARLTAEEVRAIRASSASSRDLAARYSTTPEYIGCIRRREVWASI
jgi:hypothetical protein